MANIKDNSKPFYMNSDTNGYRLLIWMLLDMTELAVGRMRPSGNPEFDQWIERMGSHPLPGTARRKQLRELKRKPLQ